MRGFRAMARRLIIIGGGEHAAELMRPIEIDRRINAVAISDQPYVHHDEVEWLALRILNSLVGSMCGCNKLMALARQYIFSVERYNHIVFDE